MADNLSLFTQPELEEHWTPPAPQTRVPTLPSDSLLPVSSLPVDHPYARYGLAVTLYSAQLRPDEVKEDALRAAFISAIETGLAHFRMSTDDEPLFIRLLNFKPISLSTLRAKAHLVQSAGLANLGVYTFPSVVTVDKGAKDTFEGAVSVLESLRDGGKLTATQPYSRSFAPTTAKINNQSSTPTPPKGTLLEMACCIVAALTPLKPAALSERNTVIIPDVPLSELIDFVELFERMSLSQVAGDLMQAKLAPLAPIEETKAAPARTKKPKADAKPKSDYRRPLLHNGNYPFAPRDSAVFGAVGLLGAIGRWAVAANEVAWAKRVLESLADAPFYIISYDKISQVHFGHHVVRLSIEARLSEMLDALHFDTRLYADSDKSLVNRQSPPYQLFYLQTSRFLQSFSRPAFRDFLAARAEYPAALKPLFQEYFLQSHMNISSEVVHSAGALGQWLNRTAYFVADGEYEQGTSDRAAKVRKAKAKILVEFESAAMSAKSPQDLLFRISTRAGRLLQNDAPAESKPFMDAVASGEITQQDAVHLLVAYMRLRAPGKEVSDLPVSATASTDRTPAEPTVSAELPD